MFVMFSDRIEIEISPINIVVLKAINEISFITIRSYKERTPIIYFFDGKIIVNLL